MKKKSQLDQEILFRISLLFPSFFFFVVLLLDTSTTDYNPKAETISMLVLTSHGLFQTLNFIVSGIFIAILGITTRNVHTKSPVKHIIGNVIVLFGISMVILALVPADTTLFPTTLKGLIHFTLFTTILPIFIFAEFIASIKTKKKHLLYSRYSLLSFVFTTVTSILILLIQDYAGFYQRLVVGSITVWFTISPLVIRKR